MFCLLQSARRPPPIVFPFGVSGQYKGYLFPEKQYFSRPPKVKGEIMAVFCIEKTCDYTGISNNHLRNAGPLGKAARCRKQHRLTQPNNRASFCGGATVLASLRPTKTASAQPV